MRRFSKLVALALVLVMALSVCACSPGGGKSGGKITVGVVNNPPSESGYREANVKDMESVFSEANGYELKA
ncbi:MAG: sugar ABC transporter substrate-binding protein, partial [Lachnospiraceae bacterium]|nr:sugar ABC transporter substrate-binding protein [Lachnospiraceae bacterium]